MLRHVLVLLSALLIAGCAIHLHGTVVDSRGVPIAEARVEAIGFYHGGIFGEGPFREQSVTDEKGKFVMKVPEMPGTLMATSHDGMKTGKLASPERFHQNVVVVQ